MQDIYTTRQVAELLGVDTWKVRRLFENGTVEEPPKFGGKRAIPASLIPTLCEAMQARGWLMAEGRPG